MAKDSRKLAHGEKRLAIFTSEKGRDRADAAQIAGLSQNDQIIALLTQINQRLAWICDEMVRQRRPPDA